LRFPQQLPPRLLAGVTGLTILVSACLLGPLLIAELPGHDPVRCALLFPGTEVTVVLRSNGSVVASPEVEVTEEAIILHGGREPLVVERNLIEMTSSHRFWLGSDRFGRDLLRRLLLGGRISLAIAGLSALIALLAGCGIGMAAASFGRLVDGLLMRLVDGLLAFPVLLLMILVSTVVQPGPWLLVLVLGLTSWMGLARLVRGQVLSLRSRTFVLAARTAGSRWHRIWSLHYLPNLVGPVAQDTALRLGDLVIAEATLSYLGLGVPISTPTWGAMVAEGHIAMLSGWWLAAIPGAAIATLVISLALIGDGLQRLAQD
jgi:peptide/nickel transport system permease protein